MQQLLSWPVAPGLLSCLLSDDSSSRREADYSSHTEALLFWSTADGGDTAEESFSLQTSTQHCSNTRDSFLLGVMFDWSSYSCSFQNNKQPCGRLSRPPLPGNGLPVVAQRPSLASDPPCTASFPKNRLPPPLLGDDTKAVGAVGSNSST